MADFKAQAIVSHNPLHEKGWKLEDVELKQDLEDDELVVEMVGSGICHTDVLVGSMPQNGPMGSYPRILGHEGSGYVKKVGKGVKSVAVGDPVLLSFAYCKTCYACKANHISYCDKFAPINFVGHPTFKSIKGGEDILGSFFGQSSFASYSIVRESSVVNAKGLVNDKKELALFSPLGCGIQTGSGTVINAGKATKDDAVAVIGLGGVGLSAVMGAGICNSRIIVGVDKVESRLKLAKELGCTHTINTDELNGKSLVDALRELCDGVGPSVTVETTGVPKLIEAAVEAARMAGQILQVGSAPPDYELKIPTFTHMCSGKSYRGVIEGEAYPVEYVPKMIEWYRQGRFPIDKIIKLIPANEFEKGLHEMHTGETVKPVLLWS